MSRPAPVDVRLPDMDAFGSGSAMPNTPLPEITAYDEICRACVPGPRGCARWTLDSEEQKFDPAHVSRISRSHLFHLDHIRDLTP